MPALSSDDTLPSSQRSLRGRRNPCGGGAAGMAERNGDVEKVAAGDVVRAARRVASGAGIGRARVSVTRERVVAMVVVVVDAVARRKWIVDEVCGNTNAGCSDWLQG